tara:strand:- start:1129 stop:1266 length:138 start_codon:yes stop_codon:yes gene_type:complete
LYSVKEILAPLLSSSTIICSLNLESTIAVFEGLNPSNATISASAF